MLIREVTLDDIDGLHYLAKKLNTVNLQPDKGLLATQIKHSHASFRGEVGMEEAEYLFVLEYQGEIVGSSLIIAQHGTRLHPAVYFHVRYQQRNSRTLDRYFKHQILDLSFDYDGPTEIGGLIVDPLKRGIASRGFGKPLSFVRFLYMAMYREGFRDEIVAELLPQLREDGGSDLWDVLGKCFCQVEYEVADRLSRHDINFIYDLFPMSPIYTALIPEEIRNQIGVVGEPSRPAMSLLKRLGFEWDQTIDPFDGGPTYRVVTDRCLAVRRTKIVEYSGSIEELTQTSDAFDSDNHQEFCALVAKQTSRQEPFRATLTPYHQENHGDDVRLTAEAAEILDLQVGDKIAFMPFSGVNLISF